MSEKVQYFNYEFIQKNSGGKNVVYAIELTLYDFRKTKPY